MPGLGAGVAAAQGADTEVRDPAKLEVSRNTIDVADRRLDVLAPITRRASGDVEVELHAAGERYRFDAKVNPEKGYVRFRKRIPRAQARLGTGIVTITYPGNDRTRGQEVRLRAASRRAELDAQRPELAVAGGGLRLQSQGTLSGRARGVVRVQLDWVDATGANRSYETNAKIDDGKWRLSEAVPGDVARSIEGRRSTVHSYTLFTGYQRAQMRGEMEAYQVLPAPPVMIVPLVGAIPVPGQAAPPPPPPSGGGSAAPPPAPPIEVNATAVNIAVGSETPLNTPSVTLTDVQPLPAGTPPGISVRLDSARLFVAASIAATPQTLMLTINTTGCTATSCNEEIVVRLPLTVAPLAAPPGALDQFTSPAPDRPTVPISGIPQGATLTDEVLITLGTADSPGSRALADAAAAANGGVISGGIYDLGVYEVRWSAPQDLAARRAGLLSQPGVSAVSSSTLGVGGADAIPSDWSDDGEQATWPFTQVRAQQAWDRTQGSNVTVGVVDVGVPFSDHEDLNVVDSARDPVMGHATHVAGLACGRQNGIGLVGMAWGCPIVAKAGGTADKTWLAAAQAIARKPGVRVVNMSLGYSPRGGGCASNNFQAAATELAKDAKPMFRQLFEGDDGRAIVWTVSAGNNCVNGPNSPMGMNSDLRNVITVAATNSDNNLRDGGAQLASFSNFGAGVEVAAPGGVSVGDIGNGTVGVWSTWTKTCGLFAQSTCGTYAPESGTSMAAPIVAGIAALIRSAHPGYGAVETADCITDTAGQVVGNATSRSNLPAGFETTVAYSPATLPIVNAEAAAACRTVDSLKESNYLGSWTASSWRLDIAEESQSVLGIVNQAPSEYPTCTEPPGTKIFSGFVPTASGQWNGANRASFCSSFQWAQNAAMRAVRGSDGKVAIVLAWAQVFDGPRPSIDADGRITSTGPYYSTVATPASAASARLSSRSEQSRSVEPRRPPAPAGTPAAGEVPASTLPPEP